MTVLPSTSITVYTGETTDMYGDVIDSDVVADFAGVPATIERTTVRRVVDGSWQRVVAYTLHVGLLMSQVPVGARVVDDATGQRFVVSDVFVSNAALGKVSGAIMVESA